LYYFKKYEGEKMKISFEQFDVLKTVSEICQCNEFNFAPISQIISEVQKKRDVKSGAVRKLIYELNKQKYLTNPLRGCWRLTDKGLEVLKELTTERKLV
jgi:Mn-dependent DtxR family transcriptional regulator